MNVECRRGLRGCGLWQEDNKEGWISCEITCSVRNKTTVYKCEAIKRVGQYKTIKNEYVKQKKTKSELTSNPHIKSLKNVI